MDVTLKIAPYLDLWPRHGQISRYALDRVAECIPRDLVEQASLVDPRAEDRQPLRHVASPTGPFATPAIVESCGETE